MEARRRLGPLDELAAPSSLLSSWWSRDNLITSHPARLYDGRVIAHVDRDTLESLVQELATLRGSLVAGEGRMGVFTWDFQFEDARGAFVLHLPLNLDEPGRRGRSRRDVPRQLVENARHYRAQGLTRYVFEPDALVSLPSGVDVAIFPAALGYSAVSFGCGAIRVHASGEWIVELGTAGTAEVLAEAIAALVYHYEPEVDGGTALTDVFVNDGDFVVKRGAQGAFELRLAAARRREPNIGTNLLLLYLVQLMAYEDFEIDGALSGLPLSISNPAVTFEGVVRGLRYRYADLGFPAEAGEQEARRWIHEFGRSREGHGYRPWVERFLEGRLPLRFGDDLRERWWRLFPEQSKHSLLELRERCQPASPLESSARNHELVLNRLAREIGRVERDEAGTFRINDLGHQGMLALLEQAGSDATLRDRVAGELYAHWPYRSFDQLLARVPSARGLRRVKSRLSFGRTIAGADEGTLKGLGPAPKTRSARRLANPELFAPLELTPELDAEAAHTFPSFETFMDAALHDEAWGYYARRVVIADGGHFLTHPEELSPHYGAWVAEWAYRAFRDMREHGELAPEERFVFVEFGAGNGRLARDVLSAVERGAAGAARRDRDDFRRFAACFEYRIYELSAALREKQRELVAGRALVAPGDARRPQEALERDFPGGFKGMVVTNELPDAFGVHKVALTADGDAFVALVVPRIETALSASLGVELRERVVAVDALIRSKFDFSRNATEQYLDAASFADVMRALALTAPEERDARLAGLWFEELYVPATAIPSLAAHLADNAAEYAAALAVEASGVVLYVNLHAAAFMRGIAPALKAGFVVTIDYGDSTAGLVQGARRGDFLFRVYGESQDYLPRANDPYFAPGTQDLTADVNFTDLARAGEECGLTLIHFGPERDIAGDALAELVARAEDAPAFARFLGNPPFKVLVLGKRPSAAFAAPLVTPLGLALRTQEMPRSERERIVAIQTTLSRRRV